ncbi:hypothetical protein [Cellulomonas shaoxiangyii]|uniref:Uncharacterized protein n=1 Tax=Cellulomonas shaoxiangyii TaxID=2566013 RepID=A0A4P7SN59_9CELL|nr:hypothetical protein [Cellulomonas shaoxiangyii]QCB94967.1 hypothetical protein E5225_16755 [Cellulomonas shaoxiangyii]TGY82051.1 hypothetical protein E5226_13640 [Cellulomonas shaoxiangyii]
MRHGGLTAAAVLALALCAGCADTPAPGSGGLETSAAPTPDDTASPTAQGSASPGRSAIPNAAETSFPGAPQDVESEEIAVAPDDDPRRFRLVTWGSSTCPTLPDEVEWDESAQVVRVTLTDATAYGDAPCTADIAPTTSVVALPDGAPDAPGLVVEVAGARLTID